MIDRNDPCFCGSGKKWKKCHYPQLPGQRSSSLADEYYRRYQIVLKTPEQIAGIQRACHITAQVLKATCEKAKAGVTTLELDEFAAALMRSFHATAAPLGYGYPPYPKSICTSLNEVICHGIPEKRVLVEGDILNIDVSCIVDGYFGDCSAMVVIGETTEKRKRVVQAAYECLMAGIAAAKPGRPLFEIGSAIEKTAAHFRCSVVHDFVAHGIGLDFHEEPQVPHCYNKIDTILVPGMTFTIEPMINIGKPGSKIDPKDRWTARTIDGEDSAQWEHTILITENGNRILTLLE